MLELYNIIYCYQNILFLLDYNKFYYCYYLLKYY